ncbi:Hypothetical_protein [Hexamita inflata]|uniref:Hypothetical_protein n=1 Tax=Hexamita inflata TaxID=28002 RepID=A0AA86TTK3_9EUKA|nr:Hypothetical protein HINF_LOCUS15540 [Hexamita inflata]
MSSNQISKRKEIKERCRSILHGPVSAQPPKPETIKPVKQIEMFKNNPLVFRVPDRSDFNKMPPVEPAPLIIDLNVKPKHETAEILEQYKQKALQQSQDFLTPFLEEIAEQEALHNPGIKEYHIRRYMELELQKAICEAQLCEEIVMLIHNTARQSAQIHLNKIFKPFVTDVSDQQKTINELKEKNRKMEIQQKSILMRLKSKVQNVENTVKTEKKESKSEKLEIKRVELMELVAQLKQYQEGNTSKKTKLVSYNEGQDYADNPFKKQFEIIGQILKTCEMVDQQVANKVKSELNVIIVVQIAQTYQQQLEKIKNQAILEATQRIDEIASIMAQSAELFTNRFLQQLIQLEKDHLKKLHLAQEIEEIDILQDQLCKRKAVVEEEMIRDQE